MTTVAQEIKPDCETRTAFGVKKTLALVFDDNLLTKDPKWKNIPDYIIIGLIVVSTIGVFLSTFSGVVERIGGVLTVVDWFTVIFFTIEIALRIWTADLLDKKYKGFWGRVRYCFSFYGFIDLLSTVPFYLNFFVSVPYSILKVFRAFRLLRLFRYMKSSRLLVRAITSKKDELLTSMAFLTLLTVILSFLLYFTEHAEQPDLCENGWGTFLWTFAKYLGDPGKIADFTLLSPWSNFIAFIVGVLGVAIFAIPTGLIASGFTDAMDEERHEKEIVEYGQRMRKVFRREAGKTLRGYLAKQPEAEAERFLGARFVLSRVPVARLQLRQGFEFKEVFEVCEKYPEFRLKNLAETRSSEEQAEDRYVVEHFPVNRPYGCCIDRQSKVTIVSTSSSSECGTGWFTYYLAKLGGFNYISKDIEVDPDERDSYFNLSGTPPYDKPQDIGKNDPDAKQEKKQANRYAFLADLQELSSGEGTWIILFAACFKSSVNTFDFHMSDALADGSCSTVADQDGYRQMQAAFDQMMKTDYQFTTSLQSKRYCLTPKNVGFWLKHNGTTANIFALRPSTDIINFNNRRQLIAYRIATLLSTMFDNGKGPEDRDLADFASDRRYGYMENDDADPTTED